MDCCIPSTYDEEELVIWCGPCRKEASSATMQSVLQPKVVSGSVLCPKVISYAAAAITTCKDGYGWQQASAVFEAMFQAKISPLMTSWHRPNQHWLNVCSLWWCVVFVSAFCHSWTADFLWCANVLYVRLASQWCIQYPVPAAFATIESSWKRIQVT